MLVQIQPLTPRPCGRVGFNAPSCNLGYEGSNPSKASNFLKDDIVKVRQPWYIISNLVKEYGCSYEVYKRMARRDPEIMKRIAELQPMQDKIRQEEKAAHVRETLFIILLMLISLLVLL